MASFSPSGALKLKSSLLQVILRIIHSICQHARMSSSSSTCRSAGATEESLVDYFLLRAFFVVQSLLASYGAAAVQWAVSHAAQQQQHQCCRRSTGGGCCCYHHHFILSWCCYIMLWIYSTQNESKIERIQHCAQSSSIRLLPTPFCPQKDATLHSIIKIRSISQEPRANSK